MTDNNVNDARRTFLKSAAAVTAAVPALSGISGASEDGSDYELIEVGTGETYTKRLSDGEVWENVLIDITAEGAEYLISTNGASNWTIRNIGVRGTWDDSRSTSPFLAWEPDPNETSYIENVYLGDRQDIGYWIERGEEYGTTAGVTGISGTPNHAGHIEITNCHVRDFGDNCIRFDMPGNTGEHGTASGNGGTVAVRDTFAGGTGGGAIRTGTDENGRCVIENCVATGQEDMDPATGRAVWAFHGETVIRDCDFHSGTPLVRIGSSSWSTSAHIELENTRIQGSDISTAGDANYSGSSAGEPERTEPEDMEGLIPLSAEEAASGEHSSSNPTSPPDSGDGDEDEDESIEDVWNDDEPNHVELSGGSPDRIAEYEIVGYGEAETGENANTRSDDPYRDTATTDGDEFVVEGYLAGGVDDFYIEGAVADVDTNVDLTATVNGHEFDFADLAGVGSWDDEDEDESIEDVWNDDEPNHVELSGGSPDRIAEYEIVGYGEAETGENANTRSDDPYRDTATTDGDEFVVEGYLAGGVDDFYIEGAVADVDTNVDLTATVNDHEFDFADLAGVGSWDDEDEDEDKDDLPHAIFIDGAEAAGTTDYSFTVSGDLVQSEFDDATIDDGDKVDGQTAEGTVDDGRDAYWFSGGITNLWVAGEADVSLEYDARDD